jgi:muramoyltetrapeptide carboxypeptidase
MITPQPLQKGDTIAFASPARSTTPEMIQFSVRFFEENGFKVRVDPEVFAVDNQYGGSDAVRAAHLNTLISDPDVKAIICSRGGYGGMRILDRINFIPLIDHPKWLTGYSDFTVFHAQLLRQYHMESLHAPMLFEFEKTTSTALDSLLGCLTGAAPEYHFPSHACNRSGKVTGQLVGGNLSILYSLVGSASFPETNGSILFLEDVDEYLYHIDRMMLSLKRAGLLRNLTGLVVGGLTAMRDNSVPFGLSAEEIILEHVSEYNFPVCFGFPAGHLSDNRALIMGRQTQLNITSGKETTFIQMTE